MGKSSVKEVVVDHYDTLRDAATAKVRFRDYGTQLVLPLIIAVALTWQPVQVRMHDFGQVVAGLSILGGLMFGLVTYVFQLRISATNDPRITTSRRRTLDLLDELFSNLSYAVLVCIGGAITGVLCATLIPDTPSGRWEYAVEAWSTGWMIFLLAHTWFVIAMCLKRIRSAYRELTR